MAETKSKNTYIKKARGQECLVYRSLLLHLAEKYNRKFKRLKLPEYIEIDERKNRITLPFYDGRTYNEVWGESYGGRLMGLELSKETAEVLYDFSKIRVEEVSGNEEIAGIEKYKFEFDSWFQTFNQEKEKFVARSLISREEASVAVGILQSDFDKPRFIFSNGDFYPRNFINMGTNIVVIDWQTWDASYRVNLVDYLENVLAFTFIHMWGNFPWQFSYLKEVQKYFRLDTDNFQKALLIKSFDQANFWYGNSNLCKDQLFIFKNALDKEYVQYLLDYTKPNLVYQIFRPVLNLFR